MVFPQWLNAIGVRPGGTAPMVVRPGGTAPVRSPPVPVVRSSLTTSTSPASPPVDLVRGTTIAAHIFQGTQLPWRVMEQQQSSVQSILAAQASTPAQTSICPPTRREKMGAAASRDREAGRERCDRRDDRRGHRRAAYKGAVCQAGQEGAPVRRGDQVRAPGSVASRA